MHKISPAVCMLLALLGNLEAQALIISEIMYDSGNAGSAVEYIEVYNNSDDDLFLFDYVIDDDDRSPLQRNTFGVFGAPVIFARDTAVFIRSGRDFNVGAIMQAAWGNDINLISVNPWPFLLDDGNRIAIWESFAEYANRDFSSAIIDITYAAESPWPQSDGMSSIYLTDLNADPNDGRNWARSVSGVAGAYASNPIGASNTLNIGSPGIVVPEPNPVLLLFIAILIALVARGSVGDCALPVRYSYVAE